jgi:hypothetical protein
LRAGTCNSQDKPSDFAAARLNPDGTLDPSFGTGGLAATDFARSSDAAIAVMIQPDGRIVAGGTSGSGFALLRYLGD